MKKKIKNAKLMLVVGIVILVIAIGLIVFLMPHHKKINDNFSLTKEKYKIDKDEKKVDMSIEIKNTTGKDQKLNGITVKFFNKENKQIFVYYKNVDETIKKDKSYKLQFNESVENSNIKNKKDISKITYELE